MGFDPVSYLMGKKSGGGGSGDGGLKYKIVKVPNDKTNVTLSAPHGIDLTEYEIVAVSNPPCSNVGYAVEACLSYYYAENVIVVKPSADHGGASLVFYVLLAYIPKSLL